MAILWWPSLDRPDYAGDKSRRWTEKTLCHDTNLSRRSSTHDVWLVMPMVWRNVPMSYMPQRAIVAHQLRLVIATLLLLIISNKEIRMTRSRKRFVARIIGFALVMTVAPVAFGSPADPGLQINNACARSGNCCFEMGSLCTGGGGLDYYYSSGGCSPLDW